MVKISERVIILINPACSHADRVKEEVLTPFREMSLSNNQLVETTIDPDKTKSTEELAAIIQDGDRIISPAGDGTGNLAVNASLLSEASDIRLGFLPYGNFNDIADTFTNRFMRQRPELLLQTDHSTEVQPLQVYRDDQFHRYALLYANLGWTAQAAAQFDTPHIRRALQAGRTNLTQNVYRLSRSYFQQRATACLPTFTLEGEANPHSASTDILTINGPIMGHFIRSGKKYFAGETFLYSELDVRSLHKNIPFLGKSALNLYAHTKLPLPGQETSYTKIAFQEQVVVPLHLDGEYESLTTNTLEIKKSGCNAPRVHIITASESDPY